MPQFPPVALLLAGFTLAHAAWSVSDLPPEELLVPLGIRVIDGQRFLQRFEAETQAEAILAGKAAAAEWTQDSTPWAFARELTIREGDEQRDVLVVDFWAPGMTEPAAVYQKFQRYTVDGQFHIVGPMQVGVGGEIREILPDSAAAEAVRMIEEGIAQHSRVAPLWDTWK
jgi:hypothetical protein